MGKYARGKHAVLIDDRSGFKIRYKDARTEWTGFRVYKGDWEPKQPQLDPEMYIEGGDPSVLYKPRPPQSTSDTIVSLGPLHGKFSGQCAANLGRVVIGAGENAQGFQATGVLNSTGIAIAVVFPIPTEAWQQATSALGSVTLNVSETVSGIELGAMTASLGNTGLFFNTTEIPPGLAGTAQIPLGPTSGLVLNGAHPVTMPQMTSTLGSVTPEVITAVPVTLSGATATLGTVTVVTPGWGTYLWGTDEWGN